jgi:hypothetical protein
MSSSSYLSFRLSLTDSYSLTKAKGNKFLVGSLAQNRRTVIGQASTGGGNNLPRVQVRKNQKDGKGYPSTVPRKRELSDLHQYSSNNI